MSIDGPNSTGLIGAEMLNPHHCGRFRFVSDRRDFLRSSALGFGASVLGTLIAKDSFA